MCRILYTILLIFIVVIIYFSANLYTNRTCHGQKYPNTIIGHGQKYPNSESDVCLFLYIINEYFLY